MEDPDELLAAAMAKLALNKINQDYEVSPAHEFERDGQWECPLWDTDNGLHKFWLVGQFNETGLLAVAAPSETSFIASIFDTNTTEWSFVVPPITAPVASVTHLVCSTHASVVAVCADNCVYVFRDLVGGVAPVTLATECSLCALAVSPDGKWLAYARTTAPRAVVLVCIADERQCVHTMEWDIDALSFNPTTLLAASRSEVYLFDLGLDGLGQCKMCVDLAPSARAVLSRVVGGRKQPVNPPAELAQWVYASKDCAVVALGTLHHLSFQSVHNTRLGRFMADTAAPVAFVVSGEYFLYMDASGELMCYRFGCDKEHFIVGDETEKRATTLRGDCQCALCVARLESTSNCSRGAIIVVGDGLDTVWCATPGGGVVRLCRRYVRLTG